MTLVLEAVHLNHHVTESRLCPDEPFNQLGIVEHHELKCHAKTLYCYLQGHGHSLIISVYVKLMNPNNNIMWFISHFHFNHYFTIEGTHLR